MTKTPNKPLAIDAFIARKAEIDEMLERLAALSADHFDTSPDEINWGHVGTLAHYAELLKRITDSAFKEGEHAE
jgi:putative heme iron utilization protein